MSANKLITDIGHKQNLLQLKTFSQSLSPGTNYFSCLFTCGNSRSGWKQVQLPGCCTASWATTSFHSAEDFVYAERVPAFHCCWWTPRLSSRPFRTKDRVQSLVGADGIKSTEQLLPACCSWLHPPAAFSLFIYYSVLTLFLSLVLAKYPAKKENLTREIKFSVTI